MNTVQGLLSESTVLVITKNSHGAVAMRGSVKALTEEGKGGHSPLVLSRERKM